MKLKTRFYIMAVQHLFAAQLQQKDIRFQIEEGSSKDITILADQNQMEQVLINVVKNTMESIGSKGDIHVSLQDTAHGAILKIKDTGAGVPTEIQQHLFTPFFTSKPQGQGLGLMLIRDILDAHHFEFELYNRTHQGACFEICFNNQAA